MANFNRLATEFVQHGNKLSYRKGKSRWGLRGRKTGVCAGNMKLVFSGN